MGTPHLRAALQLKSCEARFRVYLNLGFGGFRGPGSRSLKVAHSRIKAFNRVQGLR